MTEETAIQLAQKPQDIISPQTCNEIASYLGEYINVLTAIEWDKRLRASQIKVGLLSTPNKTNALAKAEFEVSEAFVEWQQALQELRKFKAYKSDLYNRFLVLTQTKRY